MRCFDALNGNAAFGGEIELHLVNLFEPPIDVTQMRARFFLESAKITSNRIDVAGTHLIVELATSKRFGGFCVCLYHRFVGDVELADARN